MLQADGIHSDRLEAFHDDRHLRNQRRRDGLRGAVLLVAREQLHSPVRTPVLVGRHRNVSRLALGDVARQVVHGTADGVDESPVGPAHRLRDAVKSSKDHARAVHQQPFRQGRTIVRPTMALVLKPLWSVAVALLVLAACAPAGTGSSPSPSPSGSTSPTARPADSKAANLRTQLDLLLGEHVMLIAKQAVAASNHTDEYPGYLTLLASNTNSLADLIRSAYGNTGANQFAQAWGIQNGYLVDYTIGVVTHNDAKSSGAMSGLLNGCTPQFAQLVAGLAQ